MEQKPTVLASNYSARGRGRGRGGKGNGRGHSGGGRGYIYYLSTKRTILATASAGTATMLKTVSRTLSRIGLRVNKVVAKMAKVEAKAAKAAKAARAARAASEAT